MKRTTVLGVKEALAGGCDLVVVGLPGRATRDDPDLIAVRVAMDNACTHVPLVAIADWLVDNPPPAASQVDAVVPADLPEAAVAHRLLGLAERSVSGRVLEKPLIDRARPETPEAARTEVRLGEIQLRQRAIPRQSESPARERRAEGERAAPRHSRTLYGPGTKVSVDDSPMPRASIQKSATFGIHDQPTSPLALPIPEPFEDALPPVELPPVSAKQGYTGVQRGFRGKGPPPKATEGPEMTRLRDSWASGDPKNKLGEWLSQARDSLPSSDAHPPLGHAPDTVRPPAQSERAARGSTSGTAGSSIRVPLTAPARVVSGVRVLLVDEDLSRADALCQTLRAHRVEVHLCSPRLEFFHARLVRKFTPHVVIIDETAIGGVAAEFLQRLRKDPFLQHTQLLVVRLDRMFRARSGATQVEALLPLLQPLARAELSLLEKLGPTCEVEFGLDEVPPHLLLKLLVPRRVSTQIECTRDHERLRWTVGWDRASPAELQTAKGSRSLGPTEAFDWLLSHRNCHVVVIHRPEKEELQGEPLLEWVERRLSENDPDEERPRPRMEMRPRLESLVDLGRDEDTAVTAYPLSSTRPVTVTGSARLDRPTSKSKLGWAIGGLVAAGALTATVLQVSTPPSAMSAQNGALDSSASKGDAHASPAPVVGPKDAEGAIAKAGHAAGPSEKLGRDLDYFVPAASGVPSCEQVLSGWTPAPRQPPESAVVYFRQAQNALMVGDSKEALLKLCQSATLLPGGSGSIELARWFLSRRAYGQAKHHLKAAISKDAEAIEVRMLAGDLASQLGDVERARAAWVSALKLDTSESAATAVGRKYFRDAELAAQQMDWGRTERYLRRSLTLDPDSVPAAEMLAEVFEHQGENEIAARWRERVRELRSLARPTAPASAARKAPVARKTPIEAPIEIPPPEERSEKADASKEGAREPMSEDNVRPSYLDSRL